jgi:hypothetical protein
MGRTVTCQSPVHTEENILRQVLRFRSVSREPVANVKDASAVTTHKFLPGRPVALEALLDQLGILLQRFISLITCYGARRVCKPAALSKSRLAAHLGLPTMERKMLSKCSPKDQTLVANRSDSHLTHQRCETQARQSRPPSVHSIGRRFSSQGAGWQEASRRAPRVKAKSVYHSI